MARKKPRSKPLKTRWSKARLEDLIGRAVADASSDEEEQLGFFSALEDHLKLPFKTALRGRPVSVLGLEVDPDDEIAARCIDLKTREPLSTPLLDLPLPKPPPKGAEWIEAYRLWVQE